VKVLYVRSGNYISEIKMTKTIGEIFRAMVKEIQENSDPLDRINSPYSEINNPSSEINVKNNIYDFPHASFNGKRADADERKKILIELIERYL
jgi:hypothetical protein